MSRLYNNDGDGTFTDVTVASGAYTYDGVARAADWGDMDGDGDLDLFVHLNGGAVLFEQDTPGQFVDVTVISGIDRSLARGGYGTAWVDYDGDGDLDLFRSNIGGRNTLFKQLHCDKLARRRVAQRRECDQTDRRAGGRGWRACPSIAM